MTQEPVEWLDERGRPCPLPITALGRAAKRLPAGSIVGLIADDAGVDYDVPAWCRLRGAELLSRSSDAEERTFVIRLPQGTQGA